MEGAGFSVRRWWWLVLLLITAGQGYLTVRFFDSGMDTDKLWNEQPIISGKHPLHLYHGFISARSWLERGSSSCYDPAFQAGYPKTPVFDSASRPAELFMLLAGGELLAAYKIGLAFCCLVVPACFALIARGLLLPAGCACLCAFLGGLLWWAPPIRILLEAGDLDLLLGGLCVLVHLSWWVRFSTDPWLDSWLVLTLSSILGWFVQPTIMMAFTPMVLLFYFCVAYRQGVAWHLSTLACFGVTIVVNFPWLADWVRYALPLLASEDEPSATTMPWRQLLVDWKVLLPSDPLSLGIGTLGLFGCLGMIRSTGSPGAMMILATVGFFTIGAAGKCWRPFLELGTEKVFAFCTWCLVPGCAGIFCAVASRLGKNLGSPFLGFLWLALAVGGLCWAIDLPKQILLPDPIPIGLTPGQKRTVDALKATGEANERRHDLGRVLWEDVRGARAGGDWTPLLHLLSGRDFIGGLDCDGVLEHSRIRLQEGKLLGRPLAEWSDAELTQYVERFNVRWVFCRVGESVQRWRKYPGCREKKSIEDNGTLVLFELERKPSFFLKGRGEVVQLDWRRIALSDVVPDANGEVVISLHYQTEWRVAPQYVQLEKAILDPSDPVPLIRLRLPGPVARLTLVWEN